VKFRNGGKAFTATRQATDPPPKILGSFPTPIIFSQTEIESVGLQPNGRLHLLDEFVPHLTDSVRAEQAAISETHSLMAESDSLRRELEELDRQLAELPTVEQQLRDLAPAEQRIAELSSEAAEKKRQVDLLVREMSSISVSAAAVERFAQAVDRWQSAVLTAIRSTPSLEEWPASGGPDPLLNTRARIPTAQSQLRAAVDGISEASKEAKATADGLVARRAPVEERARQLRKEVEALQAGAGATVRLGSQLRERKAQLESLRAVIDQRRKTLASVLSQRSRALDQVESSRERKFRARENVAAKLNSVLGPRIRVSLSRAGQYDQFSAAIANVLRGSGLRYSELAPTLAKSVSPRELLEAAESNDYELIAHAASISKDRSARALAQIRESSLAELATIAVDDEVSLHLLDGQDYKEIGELSTGQRCTVVLPLVLHHTERVLIVDQPEDHIDNAFIADTVIRAILARDPQSQIIFSTHNANIPVLGGADKVVQLGSDGHRGFVLADAPLEDKRIVQSISTVMEGGAEAFERRASFYGRHAHS
jgi:Tfp pilus assembly protein PilN